MREASIWGMIDGQTISFPMQVEGFQAVLLMFDVPSEPVGALVPLDEFEVAEHPAGRTQIVMVVARHPQSPWGPFNGFNIGPRVRPRRGGKEGVFVLPSLVNRKLTSEVSYRVLGLPMKADTVDVQEADGRVAVRMCIGDDLSLTLDVPSPPGLRPPHSVDFVTYTDIGGRPHLVPLRLDLPSDEVDVRDVQFDLGFGWLAEMLRRVGLPRTPAYCAWGQNMSAVWSRPRPLNAGGDPTDPAPQAAASRRR